MVRFSPGTPSASPSQRRRICLFGTSSPPPCAAVPALNGDPVWMWALGRALGIVYDFLRESRDAPGFPLPPSLCHTPEGTKWYKERGLSLFSMAVVFFVFFGGMILLCGK